MIVDVYLRIIGWGVKLVIELPILANIINSGIVRISHILHSQMYSN